jgi:8-oxo-dGTP pyrophosphatase MutT (NUDIX family)
MSILEHPEIRKLRNALRGRRAVPFADEKMRRAAVALIFRAGADGDPELLFIKRAEYPGDPWSGHIAFPGGRREAQDASLAETVVRETREETGIDLAAHGEIIGELDELQPQSIRLPDLAVAPFAAVLYGSPDIELATEVASAFWVPLRSLHDSTLWRETEVSGRDYRMTRRAFHHEGQVIWGITERIITQLLALLDSQSPQSGGLQKS